MIHDGTSQAQQEACALFVAHAHTAGAAKPASVQPARTSAKTTEIISGGAPWASCPPNSFGNKSRPTNSAMKAPPVLPRMVTNHGHTRTANQRVPGSGRKQQPASGAIDDHECHNRQSDDHKDQRPLDQRADSERRPDAAGATIRSCRSWDADREMHAQARPSQRRRPRAARRRTWQGAFDAGTRNSPSSNRPATRRGATRRPAQPNRSAAPRQRAISEEMR